MGFTEGNQRNIMWDKLKHVTFMEEYKREKKN